mgnify:CR=1 FL=1
MAAPLLLISSSYVPQMPRSFLGYCHEEIREFLGSTPSRLLFVPYAYPEHDEYTRRVHNTLSPLGAIVTGAHTAPSLTYEDITKSYDVVFCGGGNTFLLLSQLYERGLLGAIRKAVQNGVRYMGSSAGANVACPTIGTTNDMPIIEPKSHTALGLVPFNINPHYFDRPDGFKHMGESRFDRIREFVAFVKRPVLAMREGALLCVRDDQFYLRGISDGIVFGWESAKARVNTTVVTSGQDITRLLHSPKP